MEELLRMSATTLAKKIRAQDVSARQVIDTHIDRIQKVNPHLNAVVAQRFSQARQEAEQVDQAIKYAAPDDSLPPLFGVPCTVKECFSLQGMPQTSGLVAREGLIAEEDATTVSRLRAAGAIPLGVTNLSVLCMWMESDNRVYGRTNNPYLPTRIVGGSSGGEGAIVGAGASPFGLGSDTGGSIRMPAFFNGVFGHKPSGRLVPATGQYPSAEGEVLRYLCTGPICRRAEDLMPLLKILAGPDGADTECVEMKLGDPAAVDFSRLHVINVPSNERQRIAPSLQIAQARAARQLSSLGATVQRKRFPLLRYSGEIWGASVGQGQKGKFREMLQRESTGDLLLQTVQLLFGRSPHTLPALALAYLEKLESLAPDLSSDFLNKGVELKAQIFDALGENGLMLFPSHVGPAPEHASPLFSPFNWTYTAILNVLECPVTQVPLGFDEDGLPVGVQVAAMPGNDHLTIAAAIALEEAFGGWKMPMMGRMSFAHPSWQ